MPWRMSPEEYQHLEIWKRRTISTRKWEKVANDVTRKVREYGFLTVFKEGWSGQFSIRNLSKFDHWIWKHLSSWSDKWNFRGVSEICGVPGTVLDSWQMSSRRLQSIGKDGTWHNEGCIANVKTPVISSEVICS